MMVPITNSPHRQSIESSHPLSVELDGRRAGGPQPLQWQRWFPAICLGLCLLIGCGPARPKLVPVSGTVSLDGEPLAFKNLLFIPEGETAGNGAGGYTNATGSYALIAVIFGGTKDYDGCPPGRYRVVISEPTIPISEADFGSQGQGDEGDQPAAAVGPASRPSAGSRGKRQVPAVYSSPRTTPLILEVPESGGVLNVELTSQSR